MKAVEYTYEAGDSNRALQLGQEAVALAPGSRDRANALNIQARVNLWANLPLAVDQWQEALAEAESIPQRGPRASTASRSQASCAAPISQPPQPTLEQRSSWQRPSTRSRSRGR